MPDLKQRSLEVYNWFESRLGLGTPLIEVAEHEVPANTASWWYVFGSAATVILVLQIMTGVLLALVYAPTASNAWNSLQFLDHNVKLGWFLRAMHGWGSDFMVAIVLIHMVQVFLFGAYKFPRELTWIIGVFLLLLTLGMAFTGQVLRFDQDAYWGLGIGASILSRVPLIGGPLVGLMLGGPIIAGNTLSRFFALHVFVIPGILLALVGMHVWMVLRLGINDWPMPGRLVKKSTYQREYHELEKKPASPSSPTPPGRTPPSPQPSCSPSSPAPSGSAPSAPPASPTPPSSRPRPSPTTSSSGSTPSSPISRQPSKPQSSSSCRSSASPR
ncbi:cytochrome b [Tunturiibacter empetritectus]|uniref:cytochrome b n=1 Tax=Tunturiibacter empetritectus TaxID=3069691 RepID=UPI003D9B1F7F